MNKLANGPWWLKDLQHCKDAPTVFSCFHGGGGSSMGYRLAGYNVLGGVEVDPEMMALYRRNLFPIHSYLMSIEDFNKMTLPKELSELDILDGSPPCSSFSMAGAREKSWGEKKVFREGQTSQVLDDLFFDFIRTVKMLQPKVVVAENVKGLTIGKARGYVKQILERFSEAGYDCQLFLLNASRMGVPQARERTFFIARRRNLKLPKILLRFDENPISSLEAVMGCNTSDAKKLPPSLYRDWIRIGQGGMSARRYQSTHRAVASQPCPTVTSKCTSSEGSVMHFSEPRKFSAHEVIRLQTFPEDYNFGSLDPGYVMGMSVPPFMMQRVAREIMRQWIIPSRGPSEALPSNVSDS